jgi:hypothetical protein
MRLRGQREINITASVKKGQLRPSVFFHSCLGRTVARDHVQNRMRSCCNFDIALKIEGIKID